MRWRTRGRSGRKSRCVFFAWEIPHRAYDLSVSRQFVSSRLPLDRVVVMLGYNDLLQGAEVPEVLNRMERFLTASRELNRQYRPLAQRMGTAFAAYAPP